MLVNAKSLEIHVVLIVFNIPYLLSGFFRHWDKKHLIERYLPLKLAIHLAPQDKTI